jgi:hypothetical protein
VEVHAAEIIQPDAEALLVESLYAGHMHAELRADDRVAGTNFGLSRRAMV